MKYVGVMIRTPVNKIFDLNAIFISFYKGRPSEVVCPAFVIMGQSWSAEDELFFLFSSVPLYTPNPWFNNADLLKGKKARINQEKTISTEK